MGISQRLVHHSPLTVLVAAVGGQGAFSSFTFNGVTGLPPIVLSASGSCPSGNYLRIGSILLMSFNCSISTNGAPPTPATIATVVQVEPALYQDGVINPITM